jgi:hypothetical protein
MAWPDLLVDAELAIDYATVSNIALPGNTVSVIQAARANPASIAVAGSQSQTDFLAALAAAVAAIGRPLSDLRAAQARKGRVEPLVRDAMTLLDFAAANGRKVDNGVRTSIVAVQNAVDDGTLTMAQEQEFLASYEGLTSVLAPITCETLTASHTILPTWSQIRSGAGLRHFSLGRFANAIIFIAVLIGTGISLSYYSQGAAAIKRYEALPDLIAKSLAATDTAANMNRASLIFEYGALPARLTRWAAMPCEPDADFLFKFFLCSELDRKPRSDIKRTAVKSNAVLIQPTELTTADTDLRDLTESYNGFEAATTVANRLNDVYLPLLLGWLGAQAFILRRMSKEISDRTFAPGSAFGHIARVGLGALAGLASVWLLSAQAVGGAQWANLPVWALAFVAGYGIELVFAFMDRIINAFTSQK